MNLEAASHLSLLWTNSTDGVREEEDTPSFSKEVALKKTGSEQWIHRRSISEIENSTATIRDECLFEQLSKDNKEALQLLFRRYARQVRTLANRILRDTAEADDVLQEVFLYLFRKAALFDPSKGTARSWIIQVTYHRAFNRRQQLKARHFYDSVDADDPVTAASLRTEIAFYERTLEGTLGKEALKQIDESLSEDQRRTIRLYFYEGYTIEEIAQKMGQSPGNVYHHYYRALEKMRKQIFAPKLLSK